MKANELRIGNFVYCWNPSTGSHNETVISINWKHIRNSVEQPEDTTYEPIPLTEEWLLNFGFDVDNRPEWINQLQKYEIICRGVHYLKGCENQTTPIQYVHQLQNLYFALTGNELTIKDNGSE